MIVSSERARAQSTTDSLQASCDVTLLEPTYLLLFDGLQIQIIKTDTLTTQQYKSYFEVAPAFIPEVLYDLQPLPKHKSTYRVFLFYVVVLLLFYFSFLRIVFKKKWKIYLQNFNNIQLAQQTHREQTGVFVVSDVLNNFCFAAALALAITGCVYYKRQSTMIDLMEGFGGVLLCIVLLFSMRSLLFHFLASIFTLKDEIKFYNYNIVLIYKISIYLLLPYCILMMANYELSQWLLQGVLIGIITAIVLVGWYRGGYIIKRKISNNNIHFILYFCTLELLLVAVITKYLLTFI